jgi:hypothetical protein
MSSKAASVDSQQIRDSQRLACTLELFAELSERPHPRCRGIQV